MGALAHAESYTLHLDPASVITYEATTPFERWRGQAPVASLSGSFDDRDVAGSLRLTVTLEPGAFRSGIAIRDINAQRTVFRTDAYPLITFTLTQAELAGPLPPGSTQAARVTGTLAMHGVERTITVPVTVRRAQNALTATGAFAVRLSDYDMHRPSFLFVTVDDTVRLEFDITARLEPG
ncbi:YceI family protein [Truepera radiovictrix]|uniref:YceI family protein n=1 Tax=Truepera radiovictrix TaxID=332249 RepID=UPI00281638AF|nr:YceI family protein [Truepera radiovictrix]WMT57695.1 YceI family protein [Truepera radiovictrix]